MKTDPFSTKLKSGWVIHGTEGFIAGASWLDPDGNLEEHGERLSHRATRALLLRAAVLVEKLQRPCPDPFGPAG